MKYDQITVSQAIEKIRERHYVLPAIQRKFVWDDKKIIRLFDSLVRGYPIGTFLFWELEKKVANSDEYKFYDFIKGYHQRDNYLHNDTGTVMRETITAVLDGQQRLTSLYIALQGSLAIKKPNRRWNNDSAFPKKELYMNLTFTPTTGEEDDMKYDFEFRDNGEEEEGKKWYKIKDVLKIKNVAEITSYALKQQLNAVESENLSHLWQAICTNSIINYYQVTSNSMDEVLDIFVRVNSGGQVLSKSDLLFSTIVSVWGDARDKIDDLLEKINKKGNRFAFNNDFIMRTCLYLLDFSIALKLKSFKKKNIETVKKNWENISKAIEDTVDLLVEFGFCSENITSYNAIIPIIYFAFKEGNIKSSKDELRKYFIIAQLKKLFGAASNSTLEHTRKNLRQSDDDRSLTSKIFTLSQFNKIKLTGDRNFSFGREDLENVFEENEKNAYTFMMLSLLQPELKLGQIEFHQDHMHPFSAFNKTNLEKLGVNATDIENWQRNRNKLTNLQLLEGRENISKKATSPKDWLKQNKPKYFPKNVSDNIENFNLFAKERKKLMWNKACEIFGLPESDKIQ